MTIILCRNYKVFCSRSTLYLNLKCVRGDSVQLRCELTWFLNEYIGVHPRN